MLLLDVTGQSVSLEQKREGEERVRVTQQAWSKRKNSIYGLLDLGLKASWSLCLILTVGHLNF